MAHFMNYGCEFLFVFGPDFEPLTVPYQQTTTPSQQQPSIVNKTRMCFFFKQIKLFSPIFRLTQNKFAEAFSH